MLSAVAGRVSVMAKLVALSPSRANDFVQCPLKFRFRTVDKIPEPLSPAAFRGTLVHAVLERLFDAVAPERTWEKTIELLPIELTRLTDEDERVAELFPAEEDRRRLLNESAELCRSYFALEIPQMLEPDRREEYVQVPLAGGPVLRGFIDRVDASPGGAVRLVDYKTGKQPKPQYGREADFQMRFYALMHYLAEGRLVHTLKLLYLGSRSSIDMQPTMGDIERTEFEVRGIWNEITDAAQSGRWRPRRSPLCTWCSFKPMCPAWGNTPPEAPPITEIAGVDLLSGSTD